jgi:hypothetical protein
MFTPCKINAAMVFSLAKKPNKKRSHFCVFWRWGDFSHFIRSNIDADQEVARSEILEFDPARPDHHGSEPESYCQTCYQYLI